MSYKIIDFDTFPIIYGVITIPKNTILYRGFDSNYPAISDRPAYFTSNLLYANSYNTSSKHITGTFITSKEIRLYDLRYIRNILINLFTNRKSNCIDVINTCYTLTLSYGLCSLNRQIELYKERNRDSINIKILKSLENTLTNIKNNPILDFVNPVEAGGYRYAETNNDVYSGLILKQLFTTLNNHKIDGYIAPYLFSPFHVEKNNKALNPEILLFEPITSHIKHITRQKQLDYINNNMANIHITKLLDNFNEIHFELNGFDKITNWLQKGGNNQNSKNSDSNIIFDKGGIEYYNNIKKINKIVDKLVHGDYAEYIKYDIPTKCIDGVYIPLEIYNVKNEYTPVLTSKISPWLPRNV